MVLKLQVCLRIMERRSVTYQASVKDKVRKTCNGNTVYDSGITGQEIPVEQKQLNPSQNASTRDSKEKTRLFSSGLVVCEPDQCTKRQQSRIDYGGLSVKKLMLFKINYRNAARTGHDLKSN